MHERWLATTVLAIGLLSGCVPLSQWAHNGFKVGPEYIEAEATVADDWIDFNDPRVINEEEGIEDGAWWRVFSDPRIEQLVEEAQTSNLPLKEAALRVFESQAQRAIVAGSLFPQTQEALFDYRRVQISHNGTPIGPIPFPFRGFDFWVSGFDLNWELDIWGKVRRAIESEDANIDAAVENYRDILVCLVAETVRAYVELREFEQRLEYARTNVEIQTESARIANARLRQGTASQLDVAQAEATLSRTKALIPLLRQGRRRANNRLCVLLGRPPHDLRMQLGEGPIPASPPSVVVGIPAELLRRRPDVRKAEREVASQHARIGIAISRMFPAFSINGAINWQSTDFADLFSSASNAGFINPSFSWPLLNYGRLMNNVRVQDARFQRLSVAYKETVLQASAEAENAINGFLEAHERANALQESTDETNTALELSLLQFQSGKSDFDRVANLQTALVVQQDNLASARAQVAVELIKTYKALGGGWQLHDFPPQFADCYADEAIISHLPDPQVEELEPAPMSSENDESKSDDSPNVNSTKRSEVGELPRPGLPSDMEEPSLRTPSGEP